MSREIVVEKDFLRIIAANFLHNARYLKNYLRASRNLFLRSVAHLNFASIATEILIPQTILPKGSLSLSIFYGICTLGPQVFYLKKNLTLRKFFSF